MIDGQARRAELRCFLLTHRAKLQPHDVGLSSYGRRQVPGLRREEMAELIGVSPRWYERFETGRSDRRFSADFVGRVADALLLDDRDRVTLLRLAQPEVAIAIDLFERSAREGALESFSALRQFLRLIRSASSYREAVGLAVGTIQKILQPNCLTIAELEQTGLRAEPIAIGPRAAFVDNTVRQVVIDINADVRTGAAIMCDRSTDSGRAHSHAHPVRLRDAKGRIGAGLHITRDIDFSHYQQRVRHRSLISVGLFQGNSFCGNITCFWGEFRQHSDTDVDILQSVQAIVELAAANTLI